MSRQIPWLLGITVLFAAALGAATPPPRVAFLDKGEVWVGSAGRGRLQQQTHTGAKVEDFRFSPNGDYLAYAKHLRAGRGRPICSIVIVHVTTGAVIKELLPAEGWIDIDKWLGTTLRYHSTLSAARDASLIRALPRTHSTTT